MIRVSVPAAEAAAIAVAARLGRALMEALPCASCSLFSDCESALGVIVGEMCAAGNRGLIDCARAEMYALSVVCSFSSHHISAHAGHTCNEIADVCATMSLQGGWFPTECESSLFDVGELVERTIPSFSLHSVLFWTEVLAEWEPSLVQVQVAKTEPFPLHLGTANVRTLFPKGEGLEPFDTGSNRRQDLAAYFQKELIYLLGVQESRVRKGGVRYIPPTPCTARARWVLMPQVEWSSRPTKTS